MLFYRAALPLSSRTLNYAAGIIRRHRKAIGSCWRKLNPGRQALLVLAYLRKGETFAELAAGFEVGTTTAWRYINETTELLAARAPELRQAVRDAKRAGWAYVVIDGTLIPVDRVAADRPFYSGKHKRHGMNLQVIASPGGDILWVSGALPGAVHDKRPSGSGESWPNWRPRAWSPWPIRATAEAATRRSRTSARTSRPPRKRPTGPTPGSAHPASAQMPSSRPGRFSASSAAAPGGPASSPRPFMFCRPARHKQGG
jgi:Helix-turn-helix of DDE superfamily endonuclease/DDE superfamily endonuclease